MMTEEMKRRYEKSLESTPEPIKLSDIKLDMDLRGIMAYAKAQGKRVIDLSDEEKALFIREKKAKSGTMNMCDMNEYYAIYQKLKKIQPDDVFQLIANTENKEEQDFFAMVGDFFLQRKQKELIEKKAY